MRYGDANGNYQSIHKKIIVTNESLKSFGITNFSLFGFQMSVYCCTILKTENINTYRLGGIAMLESKENYYGFDVRMYRIGTFGFLMLCQMHNI